MLKKKECRVLAAEVIVSVSVHHMSLARVLPAALENTYEKDRALLQELCYGTLRHLFSLRCIVAKHLNKSLKEKDSDIHAVLLVGAYQLLHTRIPAYAAINSSVNAANVIKKTWAKGLINAVLRNIQREMVIIGSLHDKKTPSGMSEESLYDHPQWLIDEIRKDYGALAESVLIANNSKAPMTLRVNRQQYSRADYLHLLNNERIACHVTSLSDDGIQLELAIDVSQLPFFSNGAVSIQDEAAQLSAALLKTSINLSILDACAAPGGKTCHLLEMEPSLSVTALEIDADRCALIYENLQRLQLSAQVIAADASRPDIWWQRECGGKHFDRILVDAPCSAIGVIRHHPDIKLLREASDIPALANTQLYLLSALWPLLKQNGFLLYATCSILNQENDAVISQFLSSTPDARIDVIEQEWGLKTLYGRQLLPQKNGHDGFYFARLQKI